MGPMEENVYDTLPSMRMLEIGVKIRMSDIGGAISRWKVRKGGNLMMGRFGLFVVSIFLIGTNKKIINKPAMLLVKLWVQLTPPQQIHFQEENARQ